MKVLINVSSSIIKNSRWREISKEVEVDVFAELNPRKGDFVVLPIEWWGLVIEKIKEEGNLKYEEILGELFNDLSYDPISDLNTNLLHIKPVLRFSHAYYDLSLRSKQYVELNFDELIGWTDMYDTFVENFK